MESSAADLGTPLSGGSRIGITRLPHGVGHETGAKLSNIRNILLDAAFAKMSNNRHFYSKSFYM